MHTHLLLLLLLLQPLHESAGATLCCTAPDEFTARSTRAAIATFLLLHPLVIYFMADVVYVFGAMIGAPISRGPKWAKVSVTPIIRISYLEVLLHFLQIGAFKHEHFLLLCTAAFFLIVLGG